MTHTAVGEIAARLGLLFEMDNIEAFNSVFGTLDIRLATTAGYGSRKPTATGSRIELPEELIYYYEEGTPEAWNRTADGVRFITHEIWHDVFNGSSSNYFDWQGAGYNSIREVRDLMESNIGIPSEKCWEDCELSADLATNWVWDSFERNAGGELLKAQVTSWLNETLR
jgi:hypothetical protein